MVDAPRGTTDYTPKKYRTKLTPGGRPKSSTLIELRQRRIPEARGGEKDSGVTQLIDDGQFPVALDHKAMRCRGFLAVRVLGSSY